MSRSSWPFNMPMFRIQLKSTAFRSRASPAGVYGSSVDDPSGLCAAAVSGPPIVSAIPSATLAQRTLLPECIMAAPLVVELLP